MYHVAWYGKPDCAEVQIPMQIFYGHLVAFIAHGSMFIIALTLVAKDENDGLLVEITNTPGPSRYFRVKWLVPFFSLLSAVNHCAYLYGYRKRWIKWAEYSISAGLMFVLVATLSGLNDIRGLVILVGANFGLQYTGFASEGGFSEYSLPDDRPHYNDEVPLFTGFCIFGCMQGATLVAYITTVIHKTGIPPMVHVIVSAITIAMSAFGVVATLKVSDTRREWLYILLSLTSKTFLANAVLFGSLRPE